MKLQFKSFPILSKEEQLKILNIRNLDYIREQMATKEMIEEKNHLQWINNLSSKDDQYYFAVFVNSEIVGAVYITDINKHNQTSFWGLYFTNNINPLVSTFSTYYLFEYIFQDLKINTLYLEVKNSNTKALNFDKNLGFKEYKKDSRYTYMSMTSYEWNTTKGSKLFTVLKQKIDTISFTIIKGK